MTKMIQLIEEMDARLSQIADAENELVRALGHALSRVDQRLLQDVRKITTEHESRRGAILLELQDLATRIGAFPVAHQAASGVEYAEPAPRPITAANSVPEANAIPTANVTKARAARRKRRSTSPTPIAVIGSRSGLIAIAPTMRISL